MELPIPQFTGYRVTDSGIIISARHRRPMRQTPDGRGYCRQPLKRDDGRVVCCYVHRLVAAAFLPAPEAGQEIDHIDGNPRNNAASNLRWVSHRENILSAMAKRGNWLATAPRRKTPVIAISITTGVETLFASLGEAGVWLDSLTVAVGGIARGAQAWTANICHAKAKGLTAYGYRWISPRARLKLATARANAAADMLTID